MTSDFFVQFSEESKPCTCTNLRTYSWYLRACITRTFLARPRNLSFVTNVRNGIRFTAGKELDWRSLCRKDVAGCWTHKLICCKHWTVHFWWTDVVWWHWVKYTCNISDGQDAQSQFSWNSEGMQLRPLCVSQYFPIVAAKTGMRSLCVDTQRGPGKCVQK